MDVNNADSVQMVSADDARSAIDAAIIERLGADWEQTWLIAHDSAFLVRLNNGNINLDFQADLLGAVEIIEREANPLQVSGRFIAWLILGASLFVAFAIAVAAGVI